MTRSKSTAPAIDRKIFRKQFMDKFFLMEKDDAPVDVGSPQKKQKKVMEAWVCTNDPFLQQMRVWTAANPDEGSLPDKNSRVSDVKYHEIQLQVSTSNSNQSQDNIDEEADEKDEVEVVEWSMYINTVRRSKLSDFFDSQRTIAMQVERAKKDEEILYELE